MKRPVMYEHARLAAEALGLRVRKAPLGSETGIRNLGGFMLVNERTNFILAGQRFDLTAEAVVECCDHIRDGTAPYRGWR